MSKQTLAWHQQCCKNLRRSVEAKRDKLATLAKEVERDEARLAFYEQQIGLAESRGMDSFDDARLGVKRQA